MFIGHFAAGFAAKRLNTKPSLGTYFLAAQFLDLLWPTLLLLGVERAEIASNPSNPIPLSFTHYPVSHSLLAVVGWSVLFAVVYALWKGNRKAAIVLGFCVLSHWVLDLFVHIPDLPLYPGNAPVVGLGLWKYKIIELVVEMALFAAGVAIYLKTTKPKSRKGSYITWSLVLFLVLVHLANTFGSAPPNMTAVAWTGQLQWLIVLWGYWADRNRIVPAKGETGNREGVISTTPLPTQSHTP